MITTAAFLLLLGALIVVHELGHYLAARACGVRVTRFSVGFGRPVWERTLGADRTTWAIGIFPLGGYVRMVDEREGEVAPEDLPRAYNRQSVGRRSIIVAAGPAANFLLAIVIYWGIFFTGSQELLPILNTPVAGTPAASSGITHGEEVKAVDGMPVASWSDLRWLLLERAAERGQVTLETVNAQGEYAYRPLALAVVAENGWEGDAFERLGLRLYRPRLAPVLGKVLADQAGARAGLQAGDRILAIDGQPVAGWLEVVDAIRASPGRVLQMRIQRGETEHWLAVTPEAVSDAGQSIGRIGVAVADQRASGRELRTIVRHGFFASGVKALNETWDKSVFSLVMLGRMLLGEVSWRNLSGPVTIADYAGQSARLGGEYYLKFMALVSISLGVLNLLPIPVLDGGHLLYHTIEVVRRRPLSEQAMEISQRIGLSILAVLMAFAFFNDISRLISS